jgi:transposase InsO family protein
VQSDNGSEFPLAFALTLQAAGIRHRYVTPRRRQQNGKVERSHRIDNEEFWQRHTFASFDDPRAILYAARSDPGRKTGRQTQCSKR